MVMVMVIITMMMMVMTNMTTYGFFTKYHAAKSTTSPCYDIVHKIQKLGYFDKIQF